MRKKPPDIERDILYGLLKGETYEEIAIRNDAVKSTVFRVAKEFKEAVPDYDYLRDLAVRLKNEGRSILEILRAIDRKEDETSMFIYVESKEFEKKMAVQYLESALSYRLTSIVCKNCGYPIQIPLENYSFYYALIQSSQCLFIACSRCQRRSSYSVFEILSAFALTLLSKNETVMVNLDI